MIKKICVIGLILIVFSSCASRKFKDVPYFVNAQTKDSLKLNVFQPRTIKADKLPVIIFVHGGYWAEGNKNIYGFLGRNFSKKDVVTVIPSYTLSPNANYSTMATEIAKAVEWTVENIKNYRGDPEQIFLMGHSAGGHLIALISTNPKYLEQKKVVKGVILNDAAGLDMYAYLQKHPPTKEHNFITTWTTKPEEWKKASPVYFIDKTTPPFLIYVGEKTYASIKNQNAKFIEKLKGFQPKVTSIILNKKHVPMMKQYFIPWTKRYNEILNFIKEH